MSDILVVKCGSCGALLKAPGASVGRAVRCPRCQAAVPVTLDAIAAAAAPMQASSSRAGSLDPKTADPIRSDSGNLRAGTGVASVSASKSAAATAPAKPKEIPAPAPAATAHAADDDLEEIDEEAPTLPAVSTSPRKAATATTSSTASANASAPAKSAAPTSTTGAGSRRPPAGVEGSSGLNRLSDEAPTLPVPRRDKASADFRQPNVVSSGGGIGAVLANGAAGSPEAGGSPERTMAWLAALGAKSVRLDSGASAADDGTVPSGDAALAVTRRLDERPDDPLNLSASGADKYDVLRELARGGMGAVLLARDKNVNREVAMKVMLQPSEMGPKQMARFVEEAQATGQLEHPNIVPVHDVGLDPAGRLFFTMKYVRGRSLKDVLDSLRDGKDARVAEEFSLNRLLQMFIQICNAVAFANSRGVVHRDLKPANVMLGAFGEVLVMDWGLARIQGRRGHETVSDVKTVRSVGGAEMTEDGQIAGTPQYMPPEQAMGDQGAIDARSDVYALGAILYTILSLKPPYQGRDATTILTKVLHEAPEPPRPAKVHRGVPRELPAVALKAMSREKGNRYASARELADDVQRFLEGRSVLAMPDGPIRRAWKWMKRNRAATLGTLVTLLVTGGVLGGSAYLKAQEDRETRTAEVVKLNKEGDALLSASDYQAPAAGADADNYAGALQTVSVRRQIQTNARDLAEASRRFRRVLELDPENVQARTKLTSTYLKLWGLALAQNDVGLMSAYAEELRTAAGSQAYTDKYLKHVRGDGSLALSVAGAQADAYLFRFEQNDDQYGRLVPVPAKPGAERKLEEQPDFAAAGYAPLQMRARQAPPRGRSADFAASTYSLVCSEANRIGSAAAREFRIDPMPLGSYLIVLKAKDCEPLRVPVNIVRKADGAGEAVVLSVALLPKGAVPAGFVYMPQTRAVLGGSAAGALFPFPKVKTVEACFIQEREVSLAEYLEFLADLLKTGKREEALRHRPRSFDLTKPVTDPSAPREGGFLVEFEGETVKRLEAWSGLTADELKSTPVAGVNWHDASAYAAWRSARDGRAYRLPTDEEWEAAARGADGRTFSWGELFRPEAAKLTQGYGAFTEAMLAELRRAACDYDESVFGVWDLGGSVAEWTGSDFIDAGPLPPGTERPATQFKSIRGNAWGLTPTGIQCAFRTTGASLNYFHQTIGFRLAADVTAK